MVNDFELDWIEDVDEYDYSIEEKLNDVMLIVGGESELNQLIFKMRYFDCLSLNDIANLNSIELYSVKNRLHNLTKKLKNKFN